MRPMTIEQLCTLANVRLRCTAEYNIATKETVWSAGLLHDGDLVTIAKDDKRFPGSIVQKSTEPGKAIDNICEMISHSKMWLGRVVLSLPIIVPSEDDPRYTSNQSDKND